MTKPIWQPQNPEASKMWHFMKYVAQEHKQTINEYPQLHAWSIENIDLFWESLCDFFSIEFDTPPKQIINQYKDITDAHWFSGATFNFAEKLLSRRDDHPALVVINENNEQHVVTYKQLYVQVAQCAARMRTMGIDVGDCVAGVLPNSHYAVIAMLAATSLGATWSSCSTEFGTQAIIDRFGQINPKLLFICDGHQYHGKKYPADEKIKQLAAALASVEHVVVCPNIHEPVNNTHTAKCIYWKDFLEVADEVRFVSLPFDHPVYILFSSGTTGKPKCIVHGAGGTFLQHIKELALHTDLGAEDNLCFYTTCGWMMWNWSVSVLALGATLTLYDGSPTYPQENRMFQLLEDEQVNVFGTSAKYLSAIDKAGVKPKTDFYLKSLRCILSTGSPLMSKNYEYVYHDIKHDLQLSSISGGTDIVSCFALGNPMLPVYLGELQCLGLGMAVSVYNEQGKPVIKQRGELVCTKPFPSMPLGFWNDEKRQRYQQAYFSTYPEVWTQGDFAEITEHGGLIIYGRSDAVLNPSGVRIGTAEIYRQVEKVKEVLDSVVIGQEWEDDVRIILFVQLRSGISLNTQLCDKIKKTIRENASPRHVPAKIIQVADIPKTMSGKIVELAVRDVVHGHEVHNIQSLANPQALEHFKNLDELKQ